MSKKKKAKAAKAKKPASKSAQKSAKLQKKARPAKVSRKPASIRKVKVVAKKTKPAAKPPKGAGQSRKSIPRAVAVAKPAPRATPVKPVKPAAVAVPPAPAPIRPAAAPAGPVPSQPKGRAGKGQLPAAPAVPAVPPVRRPPPAVPGSTVTRGSAIFYDSHMHTPLCKHAWGEPEEYADQALKMGLKGIIFTCHCPMPGGFWPTVRMAEEEFDTYVSLVKRATDKYRGKLDVWLGLESEFFPGYEKYIEELHQRADFHFILGSVHWQAKDYLAKYETGTIEGFRRTYFNHLAESAESGLYDCLGHPDLVKNYHPDSWCFAILKDHVAKCLDRIAATGIAMELNTSGLNKSYSEMNPGNEMLAMMAQRKIPIVVGSDAHRAQRVGDHFVNALENLKTAGYREICYFEWRQKKTLKIDEVLASLRKAAAK